MRRLDDKGFDFEVRWRPFFLNPSLPAKGVNKLEYYKSKFGEARVAQMIPYMVENGRRDGIEFSYGGDVGNTLDSHRLIELAAQHGKQDEVVEEVFKAYFEQEKNLGDRQVLQDIVERVGLPVDDAWFKSDNLVDEVQSEARTVAKKYRVSGVPYFVINGEVGLSGAQDPDTFVKVFQEVQ